MASVSSGEGGTPFAGVHVHQPAVEEDAPRFAAKPVEVGDIRRRW
jgi:hypothetical protein